MKRISVTWHTLRSKTSANCLANVKRRVWVAEDSMARNTVRYLAIASFHLWALIWINGALNKAVSSNIPILCSVKGGRGEFDPVVAILQLLWPLKFFTSEAFRMHHFQKLDWQQCLLSIQKQCIPCNLSCSCRYNNAISPAISMLLRICWSLLSLFFPCVDPGGIFSNASAWTAKDSAIILRLRTGRGFSVNWSKPASERNCRDSLYSPVNKKWKYIRCYKLPFEFLPQAKCSFANNNWASMDPVVLEPSIPAGRVKYCLASCSPVFDSACVWFAASYGVCSSRYCSNLASPSKKFANWSVMPPHMISLKWKIS